MSEVPDAPAARPTAGRLLREAREKQGLHIAALAASIKVSPKKLELLESDRFSELPDATFTRALAHTVCRALKTDAAPVMALLPPQIGHRLEQVGEGLNTPFRDRPGALVQRDWSQVAASPAFWLTGLVLVAAAAVWLMPGSFNVLAPGRARAASAPVSPATIEPGMPPETAEAATATTSAVNGGGAAAPERNGIAADATALPQAASPGSASTPTPSVAFASPSLAPASALAPVPSLAAASAGAPAPSGLLQLRSTAASWVEVTDARGKPLFGRLLRAGEAVGIDGTPPLKVRIGNAAGTQVVFRGQPTELQAFTRDNVARFELK